MRFTLEHAALDGNSAVRKFEELSAYDAAFKEDVELLRRLLQSET